jgi:hypothetical protein
MTTSAKASLIKFQIGNGASPEVFTDLAELTGIPSISMEMGEADATNMGSPLLGTSLAEEAIGTKVIRFGDIVLNLNAALADATQISLIVTKFQANTISNYRIAFTEHARNLTFAAWIKAFDANGDIDTKSNLDVTLKPTGGGVWADIS